MNDFFNVLDDFELEEFAPAGEPDDVSTFSLDVEGDASGEGEAAISKINEYNENIDDFTKEQAASDGKVYVWDKDGNPFSGTTAGAVLGLTNVEFKTNKHGVEVGYVSLSKISSVSFTTEIDDSAPLIIEDEDLAISGSVSSTLTMDNGTVTGGYFSSGTAWIGVEENYSTRAEDIYNTNNEKVLLNAVGFANPEDENDLTFTMKNANLQNVNTTADAGASILVEGDYDTDIDGNTVKIRNASGQYKVSYDKNGDIVLDLTKLTANEGTVLTVVETGGADELIPPAASSSSSSSSSAAGQIRIINETTTYGYTSSGKAYFTLGTGGVEGFVFVNENDSITLDKNAGSINFYDADKDPLPLSVTGNADKYTVLYDNGDYTVKVSSDAKVTIGDQTFDFTIGSGAPVYIKFTEDGTVENVDGLYNLADGDKVVVTGFEATSATTGLPVLNAAGTQQYISNSGNDFTLLGGTTQQLQVDDGDTVYTAYDPVGELAVDGTVTDYIGSSDYTADGNGYFTYNKAGGVNGFVFVKEGDTVTLPDGKEDTTLYYQDLTTKLTLPTITETKGFTVTLSDMSDKTDPQFTISDISAGAIIDGATTPLVSNFTVNDEDIIVNRYGDIKGINNFVGSLDLLNMAGEYKIAINGDTLTYDTANNINVTGDASTGLAQVSGLVDGDIVSSTDAGTQFVFATDSTDGDNFDIFIVNGTSYSIVGDNNGLTITADGKVSDLDEDALLYVEDAATGDPVAVTVNNVPYSVDDIRTANSAPERQPIIGYNTKAEDTLSSFGADWDYPLFYSRTTAGEIMYNGNWLNLPLFTAENIFVESTVSSVSELNRSTDTTPGLVVFDASGTVSGALSTTAGKSVAWITDTAEGEKNIVLGNRGDAVIMQGDDEYGQVNITVGDGHDTIWVGGSMENDKVVHKANMKTVIDMGGENDGSVDKIHTYAAANANIVLNNYDETGISGVVFHDPEIPYATNIIDAIKDGLLVFEDGGITAIDRDEFKVNNSTLTDDDANAERKKEGTDRKTRITVDNINDNHQNMIRLFGYKDGKDTYGDDYGQLVGFTDKIGGVLDASDLDEDLILIGNMNGDHTAGSSLKTGAGNDIVFAGGLDTIDTGDGVDLIVLDDDPTRESATIIVGKGAGDLVDNLQSGFDGDIFDVTAYDGQLEYAFEDSTLTIVDKSSKSTLSAATTVTADFVEQTFINGADTLYAAIAKEGGAITVTDDNATIPNYYLAKDGAIDFSDFSGEVRIDVDGEDNDWSGANQVGGTSNVTLGSSVNTLVGGNGTTIFKGGKANETLIAGNGESSLYGAGGKNLLVGNVTEDKFESTEFFNIGIHNGAQNTITGFEFIKDGGGNTATFDNLNLGLSDNNDVTDIQANADGSVSLAIKGGESGNTEAVTIEGAAGKEFLVDRGTQTETVAQIAATEVTVNNSYVDFYCATDDANGATVKIGNIASTEVWLDAPDYGNGVDYSNSRFTVVDATGSNAEVLIAGNDIANTIIGGNGNASMWGGSGIVNDVMYGGSGHNEFYFEAYNGNDTIMSANSGDVIQLGVTLDQINFDGTNVTANGVEIKLNDGSSLTLNSTAEVNIVLDDGTTARVNRATQSFE